MGYSLSSIQEYRWGYKYLLEHQIDILGNSIQSLIKDSEQTINSTMDKLNSMKRNDEMLQSLPERYKSSYESQVYHQYDAIAESIKLNSRYGIILTIHSNFETICRNIIDQLDVKEKVIESTKELNFLNQFKEILKQSLNISNSEYQQSYSKVYSFHRIRNYIAHGNGWIPNEKIPDLGPIIFDGIRINKINSTYSKLKIIDSSFLNVVNQEICTFIDKIGILIEENI
jgi:hypothetical protein